MLATAPANVTAIKERLIIVSSAERLVSDSRPRLLRLIYISYAAESSPEEYAAIAGIAA
jgi:hypothetical protein